MAMLINNTSHISSNKQLQNIDSADSATISAVQTILSASAETVKIYDSEGLIPVESTNGALIFDAETNTLIMYDSDKAYPYLNITV